MKLVRVVASYFVAGFESDGIVRRAAPILKKLVGKTDGEARAIIKQRGWKANVISKPQLSNDQPTIRSVELDQNP